VLYTASTGRCYYRYRNVIPDKVPEALFNYFYVRIRGRLIDLLFFSAWAEKTIT
jgi:hypothetical protein